MAWIESHQSLGRHPKMLRLAARVGVSAPQVIGHLHYLWWWTLDYVPDGDLSRFEAREIAVASEWTGDPEVWLAALKATEWIDENGHLHDWQDYAGKLAEERVRDRDRKRAERARRKASAPSPRPVQCPTDVPGTSVGCPPLHNPTQPNPIEPKRVECEREHASQPVNLEPQAPPGFPSTESEAAASGVLLGAPPAFATKLWHLAASRGWRDARSVPLRNWSSYLAACLAFAKEGKDRLEGPNRRDPGRRVAREPREVHEDVRAPIL